MALAHATAYVQSMQPIDHGYELTNATIGRSTIGTFGNSVTNENKIILYDFEGGRFRRESESLAEKKKLRVDVPKNWLIRLGESENQEFYWNAETGYIIPCFVFVVS